MAHIQQRDFIDKIKRRSPKYFSNQTVLEIGSLNINGTVRDFFENCEYVGLDVAEGNGVDVVCEGQNYDAPDNSYDVVCSAECFEHNPYWLETFENMIRLCKPGGFVFFTCATEGRPEHGTSRSTPLDSPLTVDQGWEYYRNLNESDFQQFINFDDQFKYYGFEVNDESKDLYFWGIKKSEVTIDVPIPVIGVPIVNGFHWMERLVDSVDYPVNELVILNNNGRGELTEQLDNLAKIEHEYIKKITVCHLPSNIGCSGAWNMIIKCYMNAPYWIISNNDIQFSPGLLKDMVQKNEDLDVGMVYGNGQAQWDLFLINDWVVQKCGLFDENLYPAYVEDVDYYIRLILSNIKTTHSNIPYLHGEKDYATTGSQTWRLDPSLQGKLAHSRILNENWYIYYKWGPEWRDQEYDWTKANPYKYPFNNESLPLDYTTYNLDFVRKKHLGF
jgi:SAM-dependent methyltransferase